jgi:hypothetical protein
MKDPREQLNRDQLIIQELIDEHAEVSCDIIPIDANTWAIHGVIAVDGDVLMAEFDTADQAVAAIEQVRTGLPEPARPITGLSGIKNPIDLSVDP